MRYYNSTSSNTITNSKGNFNSSSSNNNNYKNRNRLISSYSSSSSSSNVNDFSRVLVIRTGQSEEPPRLSSSPFFFVTEGKIKFVLGRVTFYMYPSLCRTLKQTFSQDIRSLVHDSIIDKVRGFGSMCHIVRVQSLVIFNPRNQILYSL